MGTFERITLFLLFMLGTGAGQSFLAMATKTGVTTGDQLGTQVAFGVLYLGLSLFLLKNFRKTALFLIQKEKWTVMLCFWVLASTLWSVGPGETFRRALALAGTSMVGLYVGMRFEPKQQLKMIALVVGLGAIASLAACVLIPGVGVSASSGSWQGIYNSKNMLGRMMALGALCFGLLLLGQRRHRAVRVGLLVLCCALLFLSDSATALVVSLLMLAMLPFRKILYLRIRAGIAVITPVFALLTLIGLWTVENFDLILQTLGRTSTLSGRIPLWQLVMTEIAARPILGYGFSAFWTSPEGDRVNETVVWDVGVPHAHNGFLEVWLGIGIVGLALLAISLLQNLLSAMRAAKAHRQIDQAFPLLLLIFTVLYNLTETSFLAVNSVLWMAYVANSFWLVRTAEEEKYIDEPHEYPEHAYST